MRGEHFLPQSSQLVVVGSSPHARGTRRWWCPRHRMLGIIPACAGNTRGLGGWLSAHRDHPRMRGEHPESSHGNRRRIGSSPHARGTRRRDGPVRDFGGIIPACAGNTYLNGKRVPLGGDHPRMRGEHPSWFQMPEPRVGSSPHARGTLIAAVDDRAVVGIIPACAGNTAPSTSTGTTPQDHPRMRGEHMRGSSIMLAACGSSPHARGTLRRGWPRRMP